MSEPELRHPNEVTQELGVSSSTLRRWSTAFADFLSEGAGRPQATSDGDSVHRRYTERDVAILSLIGELLRQGLTYRQVAAHLERARRDAELEKIERADLTVVPAMTPNAAVSQTVSILRNTLETVVDNQQVVLSSQQANRELLGVVIQDNFNLKEENARLRERMSQVERDLSELRRQCDAMRYELAEHRLEADDRNPGMDAGGREEDAGLPRRGCLTRLFGLLL